MVKAFCLSCNSVLAVAILPTEAFSPQPSHLSLGLLFSSQSRDSASLGTPPTTEFSYCSAFLFSNEGDLLSMFLPPYCRGTRSALSSTESLLGFLLIAEGTISRQCRSCDARPYRHHVPSAGAPCSLGRKYKLQIASIPSADMRSAKKAQKRGIELIH